MVEMCKDSPELSWKIGTGKIQIAVQEKSENLGFLEKRWEWREEEQERESVSMSSCVD